VSETVRFTAPLETAFIEEGYDPAYFVVLAGETADRVAGHELARRLELGKGRVAGSVKVEVQVGGSRWKTSLVRRKGSDGWYLPIKKPVRLTERMVEGDEIAVELRLL
jgi:hypothetical protein